MLASFRSFGQQVFVPPVDSSSSTCAERSVTQQLDTLGMPKRSGDCVVSKGCAVLLLFAFVGSLIAVGLLVHFLADRPVLPGGNNDADPLSKELVSDPHPLPAEVTKNSRLPRAVLPYHYDIRLLPILEKGNFSITGHVSIDVACKEETDRIILHSADIVVDEKSVQLTQHGKTDQTVMIGEISYDTEVEFLVIQLSQKGGKRKLTKGLNYTLSMDFVGVLNDKLKGLYRSSYIEDGVEKFLAVSQLEAKDARRAFPCFDEPNMKATFTITLGRHKDMKAISNMPLVNTTAIEGMEDFFWDHFNKSVPMSTYLAAFVVADFERIEADVAGSNWAFNIYARPSAQNQTQYAREVGPKIQAFFEDYFQIPYPLPKQDMIAIPDFGPGAMENWGLITYRESYLLYDEKLSSAASKENTLSVIAHELAHQWFGNLVTMDWWTDLWLNEGFANYLENIGGDFVDPDMKYSQLLVLNDVQSVMRQDALETSSPISTPANQTEEPINIISYSKGTAILRMLNHFLTEKTFRQGLTNYLNLHRYSNAFQDDLWEAFTQQAKTDSVSLPASVKEIMDTWTIKMGFPVVTVQRDYNSRIVLLSQERFLMRRSNESSEDQTVYLWWVPITYTADFNRTAIVWLADNQTTKNIMIDFNVTNDQWLIFNIDQVGYYRINYDLTNWRLITEQLMKDHTVISVITRAQIMNDALSLAQAGLLDYEIVLNLTRYLERETEYLPWESTLSSLDYISGMMSRSSGFVLFKKHMTRVITPLYTSLGFVPKSNDTHLDTKLRVAAINWACSSKVGNKDCIENAKRIYAQWMANPDNDQAIPPDFQRPVVCTAIREGGEEEWDFAFNRYLSSSIASEKNLLLSVLSCSQETWVLSRLLEMSLNASSGIRKQDAANVIRQVAGNPLGRYLAFDFIRNRWEDVKNAMPNIKRVGAIVLSIANTLNTQLEVKQLEEFVDLHKAAMKTAGTARQALEVAKTNESWMEKNHGKVLEWLQRHYE